MKISTKSRYALRMLIDLSEHRDEGYIALKDIAERQGVSKKYLEQIVAILNKSDMLKRNRGYQGGYKLAQSPDKYTLGYILRMTEIDLTVTETANTDINQIGSSGEYAMFPIWQELDRVVNQYLDSITLQDIIDRQRERYANDYVI